MTLPEAIGSSLRNYVNFAGRATRSEYWYWTSAVVIVNVVLGVLDQRFNPGTQFGALSWVTMLVFFASILPTVAVSIRRLHDIDREGAWCLLWFTVIGAFVLVYWACQPGTPGANRYGEPATNNAQAVARQPAL